MLPILESALALWAGAARRGGALIVAVILAAAVWAGVFALQNLKVNTDTSEMLDPNLPFQQRSIALREAFPQTKNDIIVIVEGETLDETIAFTGALRNKLNDRSDAFSAVFAPTQEAFFRQNGLLYLTESELESRLTQMSKAAGLIETLIKSPTVGTFFTTLSDNDELAEQSELGADTLQDFYRSLAAVVDANADGENRPFAWMGALDSEGRQSTTQLLYATPVLDFTRLQPAKAGIETLREEIDALAPEFDGRVRAFVTGDPALRVEELESVTTGIGYSFLLSFVLVTLLLLIAFRSAGAVALTMLSLLITLSLTTAFAAAFMGPLNLVSIAFTVLLVGLGLDFAIHLILHVLERRTAGQDNREAIVGGMREVGPALALAGPTTALAFFSFVPTKFDGIAQLGVIAGVGVAIALLVSITFIPAALPLFVRSAPRASSGGVRAFFGALERVSMPITLVTIGLGVAAITVLPRVHFDADQMSLRNPNAPSVVGFNRLFNEEETTPYRLTALSGSQEEAIKTATAAKVLTTVSGTRSLPDFVPDDQDAKLELIDFGAGTLVFALDATPGEVNGPPAGDGVASLRSRLTDAYSSGPGDQLRVALDRIDIDDPAQLERLQQNIFAYWPQLVEQLRDQLQADYVEIDSLPASLTERYKSNGKWRVDILPAEDVRDPGALRKFVDEVSDQIPNLAGGAFQAKRAGEIISDAMLSATLIAFGVITGLLLLLTWRPQTVTLIIFPLILAALLTAAASVIFNIPFNYANVIVLPLLIGIGVDSGIHLVLRHDQVEAGQGVFGTSTPRAVLFSALTTVASFGSLMLSPHRGTASMGQLLSISIGFTLICTLIVLPAAFRYRHRQIETASTNQG